KRKMTLPLLIGGATTSRIHTAVKIAPKYEGPVIHVLDASKSVPMVGSLLNQNAELREKFILDVKREYETLRESHASRQTAKNYIGIEEARKNRLPIDWDNTYIKKPSFLGTKVLNDYPLEQIREYIDWTPLFQAWELKGKYP